MLADNPFADLVPSGTPGVIMGPPEVAKPDKPNLPVGFRMKPGTNEAERIPGIPVKGDDEVTDPALAASIKGLGLEELLLGVQSARNEIKRGWATGITGAVLKNVPGTNAADLGGTLKSLQGGIILEKLQALKEASKTGASGMGALSEKEGERLAAAVAAIGQDLSDEKLAESLLQIERHARTLQAIGDGKNPSDPTVAKAYGIPASQLAPLKGEVEFADAPDKIEGARLAPEKEAQWDAFLKTKPNEEQLVAMWSALGGPGKINAAEIAKGLKEGRVIGGVNYSKVDESAREAARRELESERIGSTAVGTLNAQGVTLGLSDEAAGVGRGLSKLVQGENPIAGYRLGRDAERLRIEDARKQLGYGGTAIEIASGFLGANPQGALSAATTPRALIGQGAKAGAYGGALGGFGYGEGVDESIGGAALGAGVGATLGGGISALSALAAPSARNAEAALANRATNDRVAQAAAAERVKVSSPMIAGNRNAVNRAGVLEADPASAAIVQQGFAETADDIGTGVARLAGKGQVGDRQAQGEVFRQVGKDLMKADREGANVAYNAARELQPDAMVDPVSMRAKITSEIERLQQLPGQNAGKIRELNVYLKDLSQPKPLQAIRDMRTALRDDISSANLNLSAEKKAVRRTLLGVIDGSKDDIERSLKPEALAAWKAADADYAKNQTFYKQALKPFLGDDFDKLPAEAIFDRVKSAANGNGRALAALHRRLDPDQSRNFAATIADGLGKRSPDEEFSAALFMSQARKFSKSARETIFGPSGASSFDNLLVLSRRLQAAQKEVNQSKTARPVLSAIRQRTGMVLAGVLGAGGAGLGGPVGGGVGLAVAGSAMMISAVRKAISAKTLMNPRFTRWLSEVERINSQPQLDAHLRRLSSIATREPAISGDIAQLQQAISSAAAESGDDQER